MPGTVTVGCKLTHGLHLELRAPKPPNWKDGQPMPPVARRVTVKGMQESRVVGGYGLTEGVDADFFDKWIAEHADMQMVKAGMIFAHAKTNSTEDQAKDGAKILTGFEPLDPAKPGPGLDPLVRD